MAGMSNTLIDKMLNASTPTGASGAPGTWTAYGASAMKVKLTTAASSAGSSGAEVANGGGYATNGAAVSAASAPSSGGTGVALPASTALSWTNSSGGAWNIVGFELLDSANARTWFGSFTGQPISVANGNTFQIGVGGITINAS